MDRNIHSIEHYPHVVVVPRKGDVDRNPVDGGVQKISFVVPRKGDVDRNVTGIKWVASNSAVVPRKGDVDRNFE